MIDNRLVLIQKNKYSKKELLWASKKIMEKVREHWGSIDELKLRRELRNVNQDLLDKAIVFLIENDYLRDTSGPYIRERILDSYQSISEQPEKAKEKNHVMGGVKKMSDEFKELMDKSTEPESRKIVRVDCMKAGQIFGSKAEDEDKDVLIVEAESETEKESGEVIVDEDERTGRPNFVTSLPKGTVWNDEDAKIEIVSKRRLKKSLASGSKFADYISTYGHAPGVGDVVQVIVNNEGIEQIVL